MPTFTVAWNLAIFRPCLCRVTAKHDGLDVMNGQDDGIAYTVGRGAIRITMTCAQDRLQHRRKLNLKIFQISGPSL